MLDFLEILCIALAQSVFDFLVNKDKLLAASSFLEHVDDLGVILADRLVCL